MLIDPSCASKTQQKENELFSIIDEYLMHGISFSPADNTVLSGINRVNELFKQDKLFIFKNCENTIREFTNYRWKNARGSIQDKNNPEEPIKKNDHLCDCGRYICASRPHETKLVEEVNPNSAWGRYIESLQKRGAYYG
jgi:phage terminase large subunit